MKDTKNFLEKLNIKGCIDNNYQSKKRFADGAQYRFEVPGIQKPGAMGSLIEAMEEFDVLVHRVTQTKGIMLLTDSEIDEMTDLAREAKIELFKCWSSRGI